ncbi:nuclear transport factor 2-like [Mercurialis annua]|uniref:nuclear transport factor 2-like n=1 Tax=Mercurialis annua TaxID=3986 RepID=UPI00215F0D23|nr:nuclear transport factor 2-like [Mercurialis annua]
MSTRYHIRLPADQVGGYFVTRYYKLLQQQPELIHQFYNDASTMLRVDASNQQNATTLLQIHELIMSLNYSGIEIRTALSFDSWNAGVLVMVSGSVAVKGLIGIRKFVETFFLAPQEKGYFVLNDVFQFTDEEPVHHHPSVLLARNNLDSNFIAPAVIPEPVPNYMLSGEVQAREFVAPADTKENGLLADSYTFPEHWLQQAPESEYAQEEYFIESNGSIENSVNIAQDQLPASDDEPVGAQKHTYASILQVAKRQSAPPVASQRSLNKNGLPTSDRNHASQTATQLATVATNSFERSGAGTVEDISAAEDEVEIRSVYVRNLPTTVSEVEIEEEFKNFGSIAPDGVVIRSRKDVGVCYAFVEFEDMIGVHTAVEAGTAHVAGRQVYIEERRPNSNIPFRAARGRGRGRGSYLIDAPKGQFGGRSFGYNGGDQDYGRSRGNGYYRPSPRQDRVFTSYQVSRNGQYQAEQ